MPSLCDEYEPRFMDDLDEVLGPAGFRRKGKNSFVRETTSVPAVRHAFVLLRNRRNYEGTARFRPTVAVDVRGFRRLAYGRPDGGSPYGDSSWLPPLLEDAFRVPGWRGLPWELLSGHVGIIDTVADQYARLRQDAQRNLRDAVLPWFDRLGDADAVLAEVRAGVGAGAHPWRLEATLARLAGDMARVQAALAALDAEAEARTHPVGREDMRSYVAELRQRLLG